MYGSGEAAMLMYGGGGMRRCRCCCMVAGRCGVDGGGEVDSDADGGRIAGQCNTINDVVMQVVRQAGPSELARNHLVLKTVLPCRSLPQLIISLWVGSGL